MMAARRSGRRSALTLRTALNSTAVPHSGPSTVIVRNKCTAHLCSGLLVDFLEPGDVGVTGLEHAGVVGGVEFGEPFAGGSELITSDSFVARFQLVANPRVAGTALLVDAAFLADGVGLGFRLLLPQFVAAAHGLTPCDGVRPPPRPHLRFCDVLGHRCGRNTGLRGAAE